MHVYIYMYLSIHIYLFVHIYTRMCTKRETQRKTERARESLMLATRNRRQEGLQDIVSFTTQVASFARDYATFLDTKASWS